MTDKYRVQVAELLWEKLFDLKHMPLPEDQILTQAEIVDEIMDILKQSNVEVLDRLLESLPKTFSQTEIDGMGDEFASGAKMWNSHDKEIQAIIERQKQQLSGEEL